MRTIYLSLGANLGERGEALREALRRIAAIPQTRLLAAAPFYETEPWGKLDQPAFLNTAAAVETALSPEELLTHTQRIETELGRVRHETWGARTMDIDLLVAEDIVMSSERLTIPHPYLTQRAFVLVPLAAIAPDLVIEGKTVREWLEGEELERQAEGVIPAAELHEPYPLAMVAAMAENRGIGRDGALLCTSREDMAHFRAVTLGHIVIMGRRTADSLPGGRPLAMRTNIILSRSLTARDGFHVCRSLAELWALLGELSAIYPEKQRFCIGGESLYEALLPYTRAVYLTEFGRVTGEEQADTFFPPLTGFVVEKEVQGKSGVFRLYQRTR